MPVQAQGLPLLYLIHEDLFQEAEEPDEDIPAIEQKLEEFPPNFHFRTTLRVHVAKGCENWWLLCEEVASKNGNNAVHRVNLSNRPTSLVDRHAKRLLSGLVTSSNLEPFGKVLKDTRSKLAKSPQVYLHRGEKGFFLMLTYFHLIRWLPNLSSMQRLLDLESHLQDVSLFKVWVILPFSFKIFSHQRRS